MAMGKPINNKSFYGASEAGKAPDIAMPPLDETPSIAQAAPDPWSNQAPMQQPNNPFGAVPDQLPQDVQQEMEAQGYDQSSEESDQSVRDETSHTREDLSRVQESQPSHRKDASESFRDVRLAKERAEQERDALLQQMLLMQQQMQQQQQQKQTEVPQEQYDFEDIDVDSLVEGKHVKKVANKIRNMEQQLQKYQQMAEATALESRIKSQYPDFEKVVSNENIERLKQQYPQVAASISDTPDSFNKLASAYEVIKNFGIYKDTPQYENDRMRAMQNAQKPRPTASVSASQGESPLSKANAFANGMTDELKAKLRQEMFAARRNM